MSHIRVSQAPSKPWLHNHGQSWEKQCVITLKHVNIFFQSPKMKGSVVSFKIHVVHFFKNSDSRNCFYVCVYINTRRKTRHLCASRVRMNVSRKCFFVSSWPNSVSAFSTFAWTWRETQRCTGINGTIEQSCIDKHKIWRLFICDSLCFWHIPISQSCCLKAVYTFINWSITLFSLLSLKCAWRRVYLWAWNCNITVCLEASCSLVWN